MPENRDDDNGIESGLPEDVMESVGDASSSLDVVVDTPYRFAFDSRGDPDVLMTGLVRDEETGVVHDNVDRVIGWLREDLFEGRLSRFDTDEKVKEAGALIDENFINVAKIIFYEIMVQKEKLGFEGDELTMDDYVHTIYVLFDTLYLHRNHVRDSGDSYFYSHIVGVLLILIRDLGFTGAVTRTAAIVHDNPEDVGVSLFQVVNVDDYVHRLENATEEKKKEVVHRVRDIVAGLTKVEAVGEKDRRTPEGRARIQEETFYMFWRMFLREPKIGPVKVADRIHNMRTLGGKFGSDRRRIALETEQVYSSLARIARLRDGWRLLVFHALEELNPDLIVDFNQLSFERAAGLDVCAAEVLETLADSGGVEHAFFRGVTIAEYLDGIKKTFSAVRIDDLKINIVDSMQEVVVFAADANLCPLIVSYIVNMFGLRPVDSVVKGAGINVVGFSRRLEKQLSFRVITRQDYNREVRGVYVRVEGDEVSDDEVDVVFKDQVQSLVDRKRVGSIESIIQTSRAELLRSPIRVCTLVGDEYEFPAGSSYLDFLARVKPSELLMPAYVERSMGLSKSKVASTHFYLDEIERPLDLDDVPLLYVKMVDPETVDSPEKMLVSPAWLLFCVTPKARSEVRRILRAPNKAYRDRFLRRGAGTLVDGSVSSDLGDEYERRAVVRGAVKYLEELADLYNVPYSRYLKFLRSGEKDDDDLLYKVGLGDINPVQKLVAKIQPRTEWCLSVTLSNKAGVMRHFSGVIEKLGLSLGDIKSKRKGEIDVSRTSITKPSNAADSLIDTYELFRALVRLRFSYPDLRIIDSPL